MLFGCASTRLRMDSVTLAGMDKVLLMTLLHGAKDDASIRPSTIAGISRIV